MTKTKEMLNEQKGVVLKKDGLIIWLIYHLFNLLRYFSLFYYIRKIGKYFYGKICRRKKPNATQKLIDRAYIILKPFPNDYLFPEIWVCLHFLLAIIACVIVSHSQNSYVAIILLMYAMLRTLEIFVYQVNVLLFDPIKKGRKEYKIKSATRMVLLLLCNIIEYILWFSVMYIFFIRKNGDAKGEIDIIMSSMKILASISEPNLFNSHIVLIIAHIESVIGVFVNILCLARFISLLPPVATIEDN